MELAVITAKQVAVLLLLIFAGFACVKTGAVKIEAKKGVFRSAALSDRPSNGHQFVFDGI